MEMQGAKRSDTIWYREHLQRCRSVWVVVHTERHNGIRVISARKAIKSEKVIYENG
jgi:uncharacterized DUF497 family protein